MPGRQDGPGTAVDLHAHDLAVDGMQEGDAGAGIAGCSQMSCEALIFDVDGTLADTEEVHRQAFNLAFGACRLDWIWEPPLYGELLQVTGGKERIASYIERLQLPTAQRSCLNGLIPEIHRAKNRLYKELIQVGHVRPRAGVRRLMMEARDAGIRVALATTTSPENIEPLITAGFGHQALQWFD